MAAVDDGWKRREKVVDGRTIEFWERAKPGSPGVIQRRYGDDAEIREAAQAMPITVDTTSPVRR
jgi:hypothetical protein